MKGIYCITNKMNKKSYIGSSSNINKRIINHKSRLKNNKHPNQYLQNAYNKNGIENFIFSILEVVENNTSKDELLKLEQIYIDSFNKETLYNLTFITNGGGADSLKKELYLIDLEGNLYKKYESGVDIKKDFKAFNYKINTDRRLANKYRVVSPEFFEENIEIIKSWKDFKKYKKVYIYNEKEFKNLSEISRHLNVGSETIRNNFLKKCKKIKYNIKLIYIPL